MLTPDTMRTIMWDMKRETPPDATYTGEMKRWRREAEAELAQWRIEHPDATLDIPEELADDTINVDDPYGPPSTTPKKDEFNEADHPRDESGKFGAGGTTTAKPFDFEQSARDSSARQKMMHQALLANQAMVVTDSSGRQTLLIQSGEMSNPEEGAYRVTQYLDDGPLGHIARPTILGLAKDLARDLMPAKIEPASEDQVMKWMSTPKFEAGTAAVLKTQAWNAGKRDEFNEADHPRDESGKFGAGGGPAHKAALTDREHQFLHAVATAPARVEHAGTHVQKAIGATRGEATALASSVRGKIGLGENGNLRQHAKEMLKRGEIKVPESEKPSVNTAAPKENDKPSAKGVEAAHEAHAAEHAKPGAHEHGGEGKHGGEGHGEDDFEKGKEEGEKEHASVVEKVTEFAKGAGEVVAGEEAAKLAGTLALFHAGKKEGGEGEKKEGGKEEHHSEGHGRGHKENKLGHDPHPKNPNKREGKEHGPKHIEKQTAAMEGNPIPDKTD